MTKITIVPAEKRFQWGPIPAVPYYLLIAGISCITGSYRRFGIGWPHGYLFVLPRAHEAVWYGLQADADRNGIVVAKQLYRPRGALHHARALYRRYVRQLQQYRQQVTPARLAAIEENALETLYRRLLDTYVGFWNVAVFPELTGYGAGKYLETHIPAHVPSREVTDTLTTLASAADFTFYQKEELALLQVVARIRPTGHALKNLATFSQWLSRRTPRVNHQLTLHAREYNWILNNYASGKPLPFSYFVKRVFEILRNEEPPARIRRRMIARFQQLQTKRRAIVRKLPNPPLRFYASIVGDAVAWHDDRKGWQLRTQTNLHSLVREFARRRKVPFRTLLNLTPDEMHRFIERKLSLHDVDLKAREHLFLADIAPTGYRIVTGDTAKRAYKAYRRPPAVEGKREIHGIVASPGKNQHVRGIARILRSPHESNKLKPGNILIAELTSPDYITAIRRAGAIITDVGGLTSHAAVVSRELGIPCIVGTKIATHVLKNGQRVEVNTATGTIRKL